MNTNFVSVLKATWLFRGLILQITKRVSCELGSLQLSSQQCGKSDPVHVTAVEALIWKKNLCLGIYRSEENIAKGNSHSGAS